MTAQEFQQLVAPWQGRFIELSAKLQISVSQIDAYRSGTSEIPKHIAQSVSEIGYPPVSNGQKIVCQYFALPKETPEEMREICKKAEQQVKKTQKALLRCQRKDSLFCDVLYDICILILFVIFFIPGIIFYVGCLCCAGKR